jgi:hypothetical protein
MTTDLDQYWAGIDLVMLDMDGTLLDRYFDDYFWEHFVPEIYADKNGLTPTEARKRLLALYQAREGTLSLDQPGLLVGTIGPGYSRPQNTGRSSDQYSSICPRFSEILPGGWENNLAGH